MADLRQKDEVLAICRGIWWHFWVPVVFNAAAIRLMVELGDASKTVKRVSVGFDLAAVGVSLIMYVLTMGIDFVTRFSARPMTVHEVRVTIVVWKHAVEMLYWCRCLTIFLIGVQGGDPGFLVFLIGVGVACVACALASYTYGAYGAPSPAKAE